MDVSGTLPGLTLSCNVSRALPRAAFHEYVSNCRKLSCNSGTCLMATSLGVTNLLRRMSCQGCPHAMPRKTAHVLLTCSYKTLLFSWIPNIIWWLQALGSPTYCGDVHGCSNAMPRKTAHVFTGCIKALLEKTAHVFTGCLPHAVPRKKGTYSLSN